MVFNQTPVWRCSVWGIFKLHDRKVLIFQKFTSRFLFSNMTALCGTVLIMVILISLTFRSVRGGKTILASTPNAKGVTCGELPYFSESSFLILYMEIISQLSGITHRIDRIK